MKFNEMISVDLKVCEEIIFHKRWSFETCWQVHVISKSLDSYRSYRSQMIDKMQFKKKKKNPQAVVMSILLYGCTTWMLTKRMEKKLDGNYTRMLYWTSPEGNTPQNCSCTATYHHHENSKLDEPDLQDTAREVRTNS